MAKPTGSNPPEKTPVMTEDDELLIQKKRARKSRRASHSAMPEAGELNLTAMMDMFTIMLVFLLKSYNTSPAANLTKGLNPPMSTSRIDIKEAISVAITRDDLSVDDKKIVPLVNGKIDPQYLGVKINQPLLIVPLHEALLERVEYHRRIEKLGGSPFEGNMLIVGDRGLDYELISQILYSAGQAQLANFKFVVIAP